MNPEIMGGKPVRGTRVPVETILRKLGAGVAPEGVVADHPRLTLEDIKAAQAYQGDIVATRRGKPADVLTESEENQVDQRLENDPRFLRRIEGARKSLRAGRGVRLEDVKT